MKLIITEEEFDKLAEQTQMRYRYCTVCGNYYLKENKNTVCPCVFKEGE